MQLDVKVMQKFEKIRTPDGLILWYLIVKVKWCKMNRDKNQTQTQTKQKSNLKQQPILYDVIPKS